MAGSFKAYAFIIAVNQAPFHGCQIHSGKTVDFIGNGAIVAAVGTLHHQVRSDNATLPGVSAGR